MGLTILRSIATAIAHKTARRNPSLRRLRGDASDCCYTFFWLRALAQTPDRRRPRPTDRYQAGNGGAWGTPETRTPRTAILARRCDRGRSRVPEPAVGVRRRQTPELGPARPAGDACELEGSLAGVAFRFPAAWVSCPHLSVVPCLGRGCRSGVRWERGPLRPVAFINAVHWQCLSAGAATKWARTLRSPISAPPC